MPSTKGRCGLPLTLETPLDEEVVRIVKASKATQQRMAEWSPELARHRSPT